MCWYLNLRVFLSWSLWWERPSWPIKILEKTKMIPIEHYFILSAALFTIGLMITIIKKNAIVILIGIELMLNAANLNLVAFSQLEPTRLTGQIFALFVIVIAAVEAAVALAIILNIYREFGVNDVDKI